MWAGLTQSHIGCGSYSITHRMWVLLNQTSDVGGSYSIKHRIWAGPTQSHNNGWAAPTERCASRVGQSTQNDSTKSRRGSSVFGAEKHRAEVKGLRLDEGFSALLHGEAGAGSGGKGQRARKGSGRRPHASPECPPPPPTHTLSQHGPGSWFMGAEVREHGGRRVVGQGPRYRAARPTEHTFADISHPPPYPSPTPPAQHTPPQHNST